MLTKETFIQAITAIRKHEELMDRLDAICREFGDFRPCLDFGNLHLQALLAVLKEAMNDQDDYISWWLYDGGDRIVSWEENGQTVSVDLTDVNALYASPDLKSEPIHTLESGMRVELLDSRPNAFMVSHAIGSDDGEVTHIQGWVDARFVIESSAIYVAMHPTAIYVAPNTDAKIIMMIDTYDSLPVIDEYETFYCVLLSTGVGYVEKE